MLSRRFAPRALLLVQNKWLVQIPRLWRIYKFKHKDSVSSFHDMIENIFTPMVEATLRPEENPEVAELLKNVVGFDSVDDEGNPEAPCCTKHPKEWTTSENPAYAWQLYYLWANIKVINGLRSSKVRSCQLLTSFLTSLTPLPLRLASLVATNRD